MIVLAVAGAFFAYYTIHSVVHSLASNPYALYNSLYNQSITGQLPGGLGGQTGQSGSSQGPLSLYAGCDLQNVTQATITSPFSSNYTIYKLQNSNITQSTDVYSNGSRKTTNYTGSEASEWLSLFSPFCANQTLFTELALDDFNLSSMTSHGKSNADGVWFQYTPALAVFSNGSAGITYYMNVKQTTANGQPALSIEERAYNASGLSIQHADILKGGLISDYGSLVFPGDSPRLNQSFSSLLASAVSRYDQSQTTNYSIGNVFFGGANLTYNYSYTFR